MAKIKRPKDDGLRRPERRFDSTKVHVVPNYDDREAPDVMGDEDVEVRSSELVDGERGVFAKREFEIGDTIHYAPVIRRRRAGGESEKLYDALYDYVFEWGASGRSTALVLGWGSIFNHSSDPNAAAYEHTDDDVMEFVAVKHIDPGDEILICYSEDPNTLWFTPIEYKERLS
jgi:SET domain-containing protein